VYDAEGRCIKKVENEDSDSPQVWLYEWNALDQLQTATRPDGKIWRYKYDALGRRVKKIGLDEQRLYLWDKDVTIHEANSNAESLSTWIFDASSFTLISTVQSNKLFSVVNDHLGTPREIIDQENKVVWRSSCTSWGEEIGLVDKVDENIYCPIRFQGQWKDDETNLHYNFYRYYDPQIGRYISQDPIGLRGGINLYHYVAAPNKFVDPLGLSSFDPFSVGEITPFPDNMHFGQDRIAPQFSTIGSQAPNNVVGRPVNAVGNDIAANRIDPNSLVIAYTIDPKTGVPVTLNNRGLAALSLGGKRPENAILVPYDKVPPHLVEDIKVRPPSRTISVTNNKDGTEEQYKVTCGL
jgi:RHS repeat-associated protein